MSEKQFFHYEDVKITNTRFVNGAQTYAMSNVTSVKSFEQKPKRLGGILVLLVGLLIAMNTPVAGLLIAASAGVYLAMQKTMYHVMLATAGGEVSALKTTQREYLEKVVFALNEAIVYRG
jgi:hypothetical protein